jgi:hypothetical protein
MKTFFAAVEGTAGWLATVPMSLRSIVFNSIWRLLTPFHDKK